MNYEDFEELIENMSDEDGNFQLGSYTESNDGTIKWINILCVASHTSKYMDGELKDRNKSAKMFFPDTYDYNEIGEFDKIENLGDGYSMFEFLLNLK
jgi:hypothetical protein